MKRNVTYSRIYITKQGQCRIGPVKTCLSSNVSNIIEQLAQKYHLLVDDFTIEDTDKLLFETDRHVHEDHER